MKIQQCFLELQLKMSGMFFETHCSSHSKISTAGLSQNYLVGDKFSASMVHGTMGARRRGHGGGHLPPGNDEKCFLLQMSSKTSVDEVFMQHFGKMSSASGTPTGELPLDPAGNFHSSDFRPPHCPPLEKILRAPTRGNGSIRVANCYFSMV